MITVTYVEQLTVAHAARRRQIALHCATELLAYGRANNRPDLVVEALDILATLNKGLS